MTSQNRAKGRSTVARGGADGVRSLRPGRSSLERGNALVETALVVPVLLTLAFGVLGVGRVTQARMAVGAVAREAARAGALSDSAAEAVARGEERGRQVAADRRLTNGSFRLSVDARGYGRGGWVRAAARYELVLDDLPLLGWARLTVEDAHVEPVDPYRSRWSGGGLAW